MGESASYRAASSLGNTLPSFVTSRSFDTVLKEIISKDCGYDYAVNRLIPSSTVLEIPAFRSKRTHSDNMSFDLCGQFPWTCPSGSAAHRDRKYFGFSGHLEIRGRWTKWAFGPYEVPPEKPVVTSNGVPSFKAEFI